MYPILLEWKGFSLHTWGIFAVLGFLAGGSFLILRGVREGLEEKKLSNLVLLIFFLSLAGARVFYVLLFPEYFKFEPWAVFKIWEGGLVFYGGFIFALAGGLLYVRKIKLPLRKTLDLTSSSLSLGLGIGRIGCFFNGCCYGKVGRYGFIFPSGTPAGTHFPGKPLIPTQLIFSLNLFVIFLVLERVRKKERFSGETFSSFLILYGIHRFLVEFLRADYPPFLFGLTNPQVISIILLILGITFLLLGYRIGRKKGSLRS